MHLLFDCIGKDPDDPKFMDVLRANFSPDEINEFVFIRNAESITTEYTLELDMDGVPYYQYTGWSVRGVRSEGIKQAARD